MIRVQTENGDHFSQYGLYTISDAEQIVNITMGNSRAATMGILVWFF